MECTPEIYTKSVIVLGCGNVLLGDDGFGPSVADDINARFSIPPHAGVYNAGTSVRTILFDITLCEKRPKMIIVVDAVDCGRTPGEIFQLEPEDIPEKKIDDFSMHQLPTSNLLRELKRLCGVDVKIIVCQTKTIPEEVSTGLSEPLQRAVPQASRMVMDLIGKI